jgi:hypothetical protein
MLPAVHQGGALHSIAQSGRKLRHERFAQSNFLPVRFQTNQPEKESH